MKIKDLMKLEVPTLKPRDPNQAVMASKRNAGGPMKDKKFAMKNGDFKHKSYANEDYIARRKQPMDTLDTDSVVSYAARKKTSLGEGRRHVYGPGDETLKDHPNAAMKALHGGPIKVHTKNGYAKATRVQFFNGGMNFKLDREINVDGEKSYWVPAEHCKFIKEAKLRPKQEITPENVLGAMPGNWSDILALLGYDLSGGNWLSRRKEIQPTLDTLVKDGKARTTSYPAEDDVYYPKKQVKEAQSDAPGAITEGWMNMKGGKFTTDMSAIGGHLKDKAKKAVRCPGCKADLAFEKFKEHRDRDNDIMNWTLKHDCGTDLTIFNEAAAPRV